MRITSLPGSANRLPFLAAPVPIIARCAALCQFSAVLPARLACSGDQSLSNGPGTPQNLFCGAFVHFPPAESGQKGRRGALIPRAKCPPEPPVRPFIGCLLLHPSPASAAWLRFAPAGGRETKDEGGKPGGGKISENRRLTRNGKTDILRPLPNRTRPEGGAQDDQRKHGLVRIGRKEAWTEGALRTHAALRSKTAFFCALSVFLQDGERFFCAFPKISFVL